MTELGLTREELQELVPEEEPAVIRTSATLEASVSPLTAYATLTESGATSHSFLLESAGKTESSDPDGAFRPSNASEDRHARYSFVGYDPEAVITVEPETTSVETLPGARTAATYVEPSSGDTLDELRGALPDVERRGFEEQSHDQLAGGLAGFLAYDAVYDLWLEEVGLERPESAFPDAEFVLNTKTLVFDHAADEIRLVNTPVVEPGIDIDSLYDDLIAEVVMVETRLDTASLPETGGFSPEQTDADPAADYESAVRTAKQHVMDGDIYQGVISRRRTQTGVLDPLGLYESLRSINPSPYMYVLSHGDRMLVGASPETLIAVRDGEVRSNPIAGTCPRGTSPVEDRRLAGEMLADGKERSEHTMLVDLARNDVRRVSEPGSVRVPEFMNVLKYSHVQHIESTVTGTLAEDCDAFDAVRASFPAGTLSGAPKVRAMEIIDGLETSPRGLYGGGVGYVSWSGDAEFAIVIRSASIDTSGEREEVTVQAGAGIVADSVPTDEYEETEAKMDGVLSALSAIETPLEGLSQ